MWVLFKYKTLKNYRDGDFLGPRIGDKIIMVRGAEDVRLGEGREEGGRRLMHRGRLSGAPFTAGVRLAMGFHCKRLLLVLVGP